MLAVVATINQTIYIRNTTNYRLTNKRTHTAHNVTVAQTDGRAITIYNLSQRVCVWKSA